MDVIPKKLTVSQLPGSEMYKCPLSGISASNKKNVEGWVQCPLLNQPITLSACRDYQIIAASKDFSNHPFISDFIAIKNKVDKSVLVLQDICLSHQKEVLKKMLREQLEDSTEVERSLALIETVISQKQYSNRCE